MFQEFIFFGRICPALLSSVLLDLKHKSIRLLVIPNVCDVPAACIGASVWKFYIVQFRKHGSLRMIAGMGGWSTKDHIAYSPWTRGFLSSAASTAIHVLHSRRIECEALLSTGDTDLPLLRAQGKPVPEEPLSKTFLHSAFLFCNLGKHGSSQVHSLSNIFL